MIHDTNELRRVSRTEFLLHWKTLLNAPEGLKKLSDLTGLKFDKLLVIEPVAASAAYFGIKWRCHCLCGGTREAWSKNLIRGLVGDCGCRALWRKKKQRQKAKKLRLAARKVEL